MCLLTFKTVWKLKHFSNNMIFKNMQSCQQSYAFLIPKKKEAFFSSYKLHKCDILFVQFSRITHNCDLFKVYIFQTPVWNELLYKIAQKETKTLAVLLHFLIQLHLKNFPFQFRFYSNAYLTIFPFQFCFYSNAYLTILTFQFCFYFDAYLTISTFLVPHFAYNMKNA